MNNTPPQPMGRSPAGLCELLCDEIDRLRTGRTNALNANAVAKLASQIINVVMTEIEIEKIRARLPAKPLEKIESHYPLGFGS